MSGVAQNNLTSLIEALHATLNKALIKVSVPDTILTLEVLPDCLQNVSQTLKAAPFNYNMLTDICGVDYQEYGKSEWKTQTATYSGFDRGIDANHNQRLNSWKNERFAVVYHLLSLSQNTRLRLKVFPKVNISNSEGKLLPTIDSVINIWPAANWYEREAYDLYGILFKGHHDLRRLLTDYGFSGYPFRKDFPLIGYQEVRFDGKQQQVIYEPVSSVVPRTSVPKVIREFEEDTIFEDKTSDA